MNLQFFEFYVQCLIGSVKTMRKGSKIYLQMFLSYLGILVIPMIMAMTLYFYTLKIIVGQAEEMNENLLVMVKNELDYEIENVWKKMSGRLPADWPWMTGFSRLPTQKEVFRPMLRWICTIFMMNYSPLICRRNLLTNCSLSLIIRRR